MQMFNSKAELVELWLCRSFIPAFHFTYGGEERFHQTLQSGHLKPAAEVGRSGMFGLDVLAGDDAHVFLSAFRPPIGIPGARQRGFVFNAADLLARGAVLRDYDLISDYEKAIERFMSALWHVGWFHASDDRFSVPYALRMRFDPDLMRDIFSMGGEEQWTGGPRRPLLSDFVPDMKAALAAVQASHQTEGQAAVDKLHAWVKPLCEKMRLILDKARQAVATPEFQSYLAWETAYGGHGEDHRRAYVKAVSRLLAQHEKHRWIGDHIVEMNVMVRNPEIIWEGRLPLELAYAAFSWRGSSLVWPEDVLWLV